MNARTLSGIRIGLNGLVLLLFLVRSLIPAGFMLEASSSGASGAVMTVCTGMGPMTMPMPDLGSTKPRQQDDHQVAPHSNMPCPFSVNTAFGLDGFTTPFHPQQFAFFIALVALTAFSLWPQRRFGNASSRSPPRFN